MLNNWTLNVEYPNSNDAGIRAVCRTGWFGFSSGQQVGNVSKTFFYNGTGKLSYANCWDAGIVKVYLNGIVISSAGSS